MIELTYDRTLELLHEAINLKGEDYVYPRQSRPGRLSEVSCFYVHHEGTKMVPGCIVGHVLHAAGVPLEALRGREGQGSEGMLTELHSDGWIRIDRKADRLLREAQKNQDGEIPWGESLEMALAFISI